MIGCRDCAALSATVSTAAFAPGSAGQPLGLGSTPTAAEEAMAAISCRNRATGLNRLGSPWARRPAGLWANGDDPAAAICTDVEDRCKPSLARLT